MTEGEDGVDVFEPAACLTMYYLLTPGRGITGGARTKDEDPGNWLSTGVSPVPRRGTRGTMTIQMDMTAADEEEEVLSRY